MSDGKRGATATPSEAEMRVEILTSFDRLQSLEREWDRLWRTRPDGQVFTTFAWLRACWLARGGRQKLFTPVVSAGGEVVGILPLVTENGRLRFAGAPFADYNDLICAPADAPAVAAAALAALGRLEASWRHCALENLPEGSSLLSGLERLTPAMRSRLRLLPGQPCPTLLLGEARQLILTEILSKRSLRRREKKIGRLGSLGFRHLEDRDEIRRHLPGFFDQHILRRALAGGRSDLLVSENRLFYEHLVDALDPRRELRFGVLDLDGRPLAYHLGFEVGGRFTWYKPTFDVDYWDLSPGALLLKRLFEYVRDSSIEEFDFTRGDETFKDRFANHVRQNHTLHLYSRSLGGTILRLYDPARERLKATSWRPAILESALERRRIRKRLRFRRSSLGLDARAPQLVTRAWRALVFSRDEVLIYAAEKNRDDRADLPATSGLTLRKGCLSDLAALVRDCPALFDIQDLVDGRRRLRNGDLLFVSHSRGTIRHLAWCGARNDLAVPGARGPMPISLPSTRFLMFDWWVPTSSGSGEAHSFALLGIVRRLPHEELWTPCRADDEVTRTAIERAGFSPRLRSGSIRLFGGIVRSWSVEEPGGLRR